MIYTSYFANMKNIPKGTAFVSICLKAPNYYKGTQFKILAPSSSILLDYKADGDEVKYTERFNKEILSKLNAEYIIQTLSILSKKAENICLLCYEIPNDFCHRHLVAKWLNENGYECREYI